MKSPRDEDFLQIFMAYAKPASFREAIGILSIGYLNWILGEVSFK
jgi:hypothetical protein